MENDPESIRKDIEETRARMEGTVEALTYKTDVPARAKDAVDDRVDSAKHVVSEALGSAQTVLGDAAFSVRAKVSDAVADAEPIISSVSDAIGRAGSTAQIAADGASAALPSGEQTRAALSGAKKIVADNPLGLVFGSVAVGFLLGLMFPVSKLERERIGPIGERLSDSAKAAASGMVAQGKAAVSQVVSDTLSDKDSKHGAS